MHHIYINYLYTCFECVNQVLGHLPYHSWVRIALCLFFKENLSELTLIFISMETELLTLHFNQNSFLKYSSWLD